MLMASNIRTYLLLLALGTSLVWIAMDSIRFYQQYKSLQQQKVDYAEINKLNYGIFDITAWRSKALDLFSKQIDQFQIDPSAYKEVEKELQKYLRGVHRDYLISGKLFDQLFADAEKEGKVNKLLLKILKEQLPDQITNLNLPQHIPSMATQLAKELKKNEPRIREILASELQKLLASTDPYPQSDPRIPIFEKYKTDNWESCNALLKGAITDQETTLDQSLQKIIWACIIWIITVLTSLYGAWLPFRIGLSLLTMASIGLLILGIKLPMMEIDARLNSFVISILNQDLEFGQQTLFYQSKSILEVTETLLEGKGWDLKLVGVLILCFSVVFPFLKLLLSVGYLFSERIKSSQIARGFIFYLGKWSMADVFVVALFMAYIGLYGLVVGQLSQLERNQGGFAVETLNYSKLCPGAVFFTLYCVLSISIGIWLTKYQIKNNSKSKEPPQI